MKYLLDVNALVALGFSDHIFYERVSLWVGTQKSAQLATCSIIELGFLRVIDQAPMFDFNIAQARAHLARMKKTSPVPFTFIEDGNDITQLPAWVKTAKQTTDGHLVQLAAENGAVFATLDEKIPGAYLIPHI